MKNPVKEPDKGFLTFGTVLHSVIERWLKAPVLGITDEQLYPKGWMTTKDGQAISTGEGALIRELITKAIDEGIIARLPGQMVEHNFVRQIDKNVYINSTIDLIDLEGVVDHKTTKAMKWAKSPAALRTNGQLLTYAKEWLTLKRERGEPVPAQIKLQHNVFCKDPDDKRVRRTIAHVTPEEVETNWQRTIGDTIPKMLLVKDATEWHHVAGPGPDGGMGSACNDYGGCFARSLCSKRVTFERFINPPQSLNTTQQGDQMSILDTLKKKAAEQGSAPPAAAPAATRAPVVIAATALPPKEIAVAAQVLRTTAGGAVPPPAPERQTPPWAIGSCVACGGSGFNTMGNPCRICDDMRRKARGITSSYFALTPQKDGTISWTPHAEHVDALRSLGYKGPLEGAHDATGEAEVKVTERAAAAPVEEAEQEVEQETEQDEEPAPLVPPPTTHRRGPGRPRKGEERASQAVAQVKLPPEGFVLFLGCRLMEGNINPLYMEQIIATVGPEIADALKLGTFFELDVWKRQDVLASNAEGIAKRCLGHSVMVNQLTQENKRLIEALAARAKSVFVADGFYSRPA